MERYISEKRTFVIYPQKSALYCTFNANTCILHLSNSLEESQCEVLNSRMVKLMPCRNFKCWTNCCLISILHCLLQQAQNAAAHHPSSPYQDTAPPPAGMKVEARDTPYVTSPPPPPPPPPPHTLPESHHHLGGSYPAYHHHHHHHHHSHHHHQDLPHTDRKDVLY